MSYFDDTLSGQNQKLLVLAIESKTGFTWGFGIQGHRKRWTGFETTIT
jgi:hypothetical protein